MVTGAAEKTEVGVEGRKSDKTVLLLAKRRLRPVEKRVIIRVRATERM